MSKVLIVVDVQNDFVTGVLGTKEAVAAIPYIQEKIREYQNEGVIFFTQDTHDEHYLETQEGKLLPVPHCIQDTEGWELYNDIDDHIGTQILKRSFGSDTLPMILYADRKDIESIELVGLCTDICVVSNALILKAYFPEVPIKVYEPACAGTTVEKHKAALEVMKSCQIEVYGAINTYMNQPE